MYDPFDSQGLTWRITPDLLAIVGPDGHFKDVNPSWTRVLDHPVEAIRDRPFVDFLHPDDVDPSLAAFERVKSGLPVLSFENRYRHADGSYRWLSWNAVPEGDLYFCSTRDVTDAKVMAESLRERALEGRLREEFIAVLGHDLRNPLAAVTSALRIVKRNPSGPRTPEVIDMAEHAVDRMTGLIDDLLDFARARLGGDIGVDLRQGVDLRPVIEQTVEEVRLSHPDATIREDYAHGDPFTCDPDRIGQLVSNLLGNAVAHGDRSRPIRIATIDDGPTVRITVTNEGRTIPPEHRAELFEPFTRVDLGGLPDGLGLGLYICRSIVKGHGGSLTVSSENGITTFSTRLPRGPVDPYRS